MNTTGKKIVIILCLFTGFANACELIESEELFSYDHARCAIDNKDYLFDLTSMGQTVDVKKTETAIQLSSYIGNNSEQSIYIDLRGINPLASIAESVERFAMDYDNKITTCRVAIEKELVPNKKFDFSTYFVYLETNNHQQGLCQNSYTPHFSLDDLLAQLANGENDFLTPFKDPLRYVAYLKTYPIKTSNEAVYTKISLALLKKRLLDEAILITTNLIRYNEDNLNAQLILADSYYEAGGKNRDKAKTLYKEFISKSSRLGMQVPSRVRKRI